MWLGQSEILTESILPSTHTIFPVPLASAQLQSIMDAPPCLTVGEIFFSTKASPFFSKHTFFGGGQKLQFRFYQFQKASGFFMFSFVYFRRLILCRGCRKGLCCFKYIVLLSCEQLDLCLLLFFTALLQWCVGSSEHFSPDIGHSIWHLFGLPDLALTSTVPFIFHFLKIFLTV